MSSVDDSEPTYSSITSLKTNKDDDTLDEFPNDADAVTDDDEDNLKCETHLNADNHRQCTTKAAHDAVLGKINAYLAKKTLTATEVPHLDSTSLLAKGEDVVKTFDLDVSTNLTEQIKDPVLGTVRSWLRNEIIPEPKSPQFQLSHGLLRFCQELDRLLTEDEGQLVFYNEPSDKMDEKNLRICLPLSVLLA